MSKSQFHLLNTKRFLPFVITVLLGATNDNVFKNTLLILLLFSVGHETQMEESVLVTLASGVFIIPFFVFSATAGQLADKFEKSSFIQWIKFAEVLIMGAGVLALQFGDVFSLFTVLFLMGVQSSFLGPLKYSILPALLNREELIAGNALVEAGTFIAILAGTIIGGLTIGWENGVNIASAIVLSLAVIGWLCSFGIPLVLAPQPELKVNHNIVSQTMRLIGRMRQNFSVFQSIIGISWFWLVGITLLTQFPNLAKSNYNADHEVITFLMVIAVLGIAIGSMVCNSLLKCKISARYVPTAAFWMSLFLLDLWFACPSAPAKTLLTLDMFLKVPTNWRVICDLLAVSVCGGIFTVPLYAIMQSFSDRRERSQIVAVNNIMNALFMVVGSLLAGVALQSGYSVPDLFLIIALVNVFIVFYMMNLQRNLEY